MIKSYKSKNYNFVFNMRNGMFARWGKTTDDDPQMAPGPELLDIELSTICSQGCHHCYKSNTKKGKNMSFETFKKLFSKFDLRFLTQIAFGIGDIDANPDLWKILEYCRENGVIPNITIKPQDVDWRLSVCGAVAISNYGEKTYRAVKSLSKIVKQVNIHQILAEETLDECYQLIDDFDSIEGLNSIVFLTLKEKGKRNKLHTLRDLDKFRKLVEYAFERKARIGFDSCTASNFLKVVDDERIKMMVEPCESTLFSLYCNVDGIAYPCSFCEGEEGFEGINILEEDDFWNSMETKNFRKLNIVNGRKCCVFNLEGSSNEKKRYGKSAEKSHC